MWERYTEAFDELEGSKARCKGLNFPDFQARGIFPRLFFPKLAFVSRKSITGFFSSNSKRVGGPICNVYGFGRSSGRLGREIYVQVGIFPKFSPFRVRSHALCILFAPFLLPTWFPKGIYAFEFFPGAFERV